MAARGGRWRASSRAVDRSERRSPRVLAEQREPGARDGRHGVAEQGGRARGRSSAPLDAGRRVLRTEAEALSALAEALDGRFERAVERLARTRGRVVVTGMGKSGHIARKIAATLASTGTPALYVHPAEASHGDLGMITRDDAVLALSNSGETPELADIVAYTRRFSIPLLADGRPGRTAAWPKPPTWPWCCRPRPEACPMGLAPDHLDHGDAGARRCARGGAARAARLWRARVQPAASGRQARQEAGPGRAADASRRRICRWSRSTRRCRDVMLEMTAKRLGCVGVVDGCGALAGIITDGDLRRHMQDRPARAPRGRDHDRGAAHDPAARARRRGDAR